MRLTLWLVAWNTARYGLKHYAKTCKKHVKTCILFALKKVSELRGLLQGISWAQLTLFTIFFCPNKGFSNCNSFTYYGASKICWAWESCTDLVTDDCDDCISGDASCPSEVSGGTLNYYALRWLIFWCFLSPVEVCSAPGLCIGTQVGYETQVASEADCLSGCKENNDCNWYSYDSTR